MVVYLVLKSILLALLRFYQVAISAFFGNCCRFEPTCSSFAMTAIQQHGCLKGCYMTTKRLLRCHPWHAGGYDPVP